MPSQEQRAVELLRIGSGQPDAEFREGQAEAILHVAEGRGRLLVVQKTGWGKSFVYFIATKLMRESGRGPALLVSPLLSLMRNQIAAAERMGVHAVTINSGNQDEWNEVERQIDRDEVDIVLISPERLANERFRTGVLARVGDRISLLVIDEAHCISDWGHDFRPQYRLIERTVQTLPANLGILATTATANDRVMEDLKGVLGPNLDVSRGDLDRPSLMLQTIRLPDQAARLAWLATQLDILEGHGIIYALTIRDAETVTRWLRSRGFDVESYTGQSENRPELEDALLENRVKALVATTALGMGFDKPDLAFVIHYQMPGSVVAYYQQVGRAGRALDAAYGVLLAGDEDTDISDYFIESAFPSRAEVGEILEALEHAPDGLSVRELTGQVNIRQSRVQKAIDLLELEVPAPLARDGSNLQLTAANLRESFWERAERLTSLRRHEQSQMQDYVALTSGHMEFLIDALDGDVGTSTSPALQRLTTNADPVVEQEAEVFLRRTAVTIEPRKQWPVGGGLRSEFRGNIPDSHRALPGRALCTWGSSVFGRLARDGKYQDGRFADELVDACAEMIRTWKPAPAPQWVTCIPSLRHRELVPDFAQRLAAALTVPFHDVLERTGEGPQQKEMENSSFQARNVDKTLAVGGSLPAGPVLLVDDVVDSRWTMTVAAALLRSSGSGDVLPLAIADAS